MKGQFSPGFHLILSLDFPGELLRKGSASTMAVWDHSDTRGGREEDPEASEG